MQGRELCSRIGLGQEAVLLVEEALTEELFQDYKVLYKKGHRKCFDAILAKENANAVFLSFFCRIACDVFDVYREKQIPEQVFWDTFRDITYWCENCYREYGEYGIHEYDWFWRHIDLTIFRLGRLEFELLEAEAAVEGKLHAIRKGQPIIYIHIPQGEPLVWERCEQSFAQAYRWFGTKRPYVCHSWLLFSGLRDLLPKESNILKFQSHFNLLEEDYREHEAEWRIFGKVLDDPARYPEKTSLQRAAKAYLLAGGRLGNGVGVYEEEEKNVREGI